jgi:hypothetical protein
MSFHAAIADSRAAVTAGPALTLSSGGWLRLYLLSHLLAAPVPWPIGSMPVLPCLPQHPAGDHQVSTTTLPPSPTAPAAQNKTHYNPSL